MKRRGKKVENMIFTFLALGLGILALIQGQFGGVRSIERSESPIMFWSSVGLFFLVAAYNLFRWMRESRFKDSK